MAASSDGSCRPFHFVRRYRWISSLLLAAILYFATFVLQEALRFASTNDDAISIPKNANTAATKISLPAFREPDQYVNQTIPHKNDYGTMKDYPDFVFRIVQNPPSPAITHENWMMAPQTSTTPWANLTTFAFECGFFTQGFRNQIMTFVTFVLYCLIVEGHGQILLDSIRQQDFLYSNELVVFEDLWDVEHWNSYFPMLPRLVQYDPILHSQWKRGVHATTHGSVTCANEAHFPWYPHNKHNENKSKIDENDAYQWTDYTNTTLYKERTFPYTSTKDQYWYFDSYYRPYRRDERFVVDNNSTRPHPTEILIMTQALRPHPDLRAIMKRATTTGNDDGKYIALHARVEPDMQRHPVCIKKKVRRLDDIFGLMEAHFGNDAPARRLFVAINRQDLERAVPTTIPPNASRDDKSIDWLAVDNLQTLNKATQKGLWNGTVHVFEFGAAGLKKTKYKDRPYLVGALVDYFLSLNATIFVGTEISSFSHNIITTRFFRENFENYKYVGRPKSFHQWTTPDMKDPPGFLC